MQEQTDNITRIFYDSEKLKEIIIKYMDFEKKDTLKKNIYQF